MASQDPDEQQRLKALQQRWDKDFGPPISRRRQILSALAIIGGIIGLIVLAFLSVPK